MTREEGIKQIDGARWERGDYECLNLLVNNEDDAPVHAWLQMRPAYCDRGHIQLNIDGPLELDEFDSFPRYFFSFTEADAHTRNFLKWRLWKERLHSDAEARSAFLEQRITHEIAQEITLLDATELRPWNYAELSPEVQWQIDRMLGILGWE